jgi:hypothetical protein
MRAIDLEYEADRGDTRDRSGRFIDVLDTAVRKPSARKRSEDSFSSLLHAVTTMVHPMVTVMSLPHPHTRPGSPGRVGLSGCRAAGLRTAARGTAGALCERERAGQCQRCSQNKCFHFHRRFLKPGWKPKDEIELSQFGSYFFRMPVSVLLRLFTALFAAGVFTAADEDDPPPGSA